MVERYKPSRALREQTHAAQAVDYSKLATAVVRAIVMKQRDIVIMLPYFANIAEDFPKGVCIKKTVEHNFFRCKVFRLANWLHKHGHLAMDSKGIVLSMRSVVNLDGQLQRLVDDPAGNLYNGQLVIKNVKESLE